MNDEQEIEKIKTLAAEYAKDFEITYDKIKVKLKTGHVIFRTDTDRTGGWSEGTPGVSVEVWMICHYFALKQKWETAARVDEVYRFSEAMINHKTPMLYRSVRLDELQATQSDQKETT